MKKDDFKRGIEAEAKADAAREEKVAKGLRFLGDRVKELKEQQSEVADTQQLILEDMAAQEGKNLYGLTYEKSVSELDHNEKKALCACIYTLISKYGQNSEYQKQYYFRLEECLGIIDRDDSFNFSSLENVENHSDRKVMLKVICTFLFLKDCSYSFAKDDAPIDWLRNFSTDKEINETCGIIEKEFRALGTDGLINGLLPSTTDSAEQEATDVFPEAVNDYLESSSDNYNEIDDYSLLVSCITDHIEESDNFGKPIEEYSEIVKKELSKDYPRVSYDTIIGVNKIGNGYLFFTTYAMYVKEGNMIKGAYRCLPYKNIDVAGIAMTDGKVKGTRKLIIPYISEDNTARTISIDDSVLTEESLRDLLKDIAQSDCFIAESDRFIKLFECSEEIRESFLKLLIYVLKKNNNSLSEAITLAALTDMVYCWNTVSEAIESVEDYQTELAHFKSSIPYPSVNVVCKEALHTIVHCLFASNAIAGRDRSLLSDAADQALRLLDVKQLSVEEYNLLIIKYKNSEPITSIGNYKALLDILLPEEQSQKIVNKEGIISGLQNTITYLERKPSEVIKRFARDAIDGADESIQLGKDKLKQIFAKKEDKSESHNTKQELPEAIIANLKNSEIKLLLPLGYTKLKKGKNIKDILSQFDNSLVYQKSVETSNNIVLIFKTDAENAMNFEDVSGLIEGIHSCLADNQGLIEAKSGKTKRGYDYIYSIVKTAMEPFGVQYYLRMNIRSKGEILEIQAQFIEAGNTGMRESMAMCFAQNAGLVHFTDDKIEGWLEDPYDPEYKKGLLMNLAEREGLDGLFPYNPLTQARELLLALINDKYVIIKKESEDDESANSESEPEEAEDEGKGNDDRDDFLKVLFAKDGGCRRHTYDVTV